MNRELSGDIKEAARKNGADLVGIVRVADLHDRQLLLLFRLPGPMPGYSDSLNEKKRHWARPNADILNLYS
jgi:hypothetical protein